MKKLWIVPALAALLTACSHHPKDPAKRMEKMEDKISSELNLNDDQRAKLHDVFMAKKAIMEEKKPRKMELKREMVAMIEAPKLDRAQFKMLMEKKEDLSEDKADAILSEVYPKLEIFHASLSTDQRKKAAECIEKHAKHGMY